MGFRQVVVVFLFLGVIRAKELIQGEVDWDKDREVKADGNKKEFQSKLNSETTEEWLQEGVKTHNILREQHGSGPLELDYKLAYEAQKWVDGLVKTADASKKASYRHSGVDGQGENIAFKFPTGAKADPSKFLNVPGSWPATDWYKEIKDHDYKDKNLNPKSGHFTQLVWADTKLVGCARGMAKEAKALFVVCRYTPQGNMEGEFASNVKRPKSGDANAIPDFAKLNIKT